MKNNKVLELIAEGQELIALFLGFTQKSYTPESEKLWCDHKHGLPVGELKFHESWEWLMPVVEAIQKLNPNYELRLFRNIDGWACNITHGDIYRTSYATSNSQIEAVFGSVVNFIKWYNSQRVGAINSKTSARQ